MDPEVIEASTDLQMLSPGPSIPRYQDSTKDGGLKTFLLGLVITLLVSYTSHCPLLSSSWSRTSEETSLLALPGPSLDSPQPLPLSPRPPYFIDPKGQVVVLGGSGELFSNLLSSRCLVFFGEKWFPEFCFGLYSELLVFLFKIIKSWFENTWFENTWFEKILKINPIIVYYLFSVWWC